MHQVVQLTDRTWRDLSMDAVFERIDRCTTSAGRHRLRERLRAPKSDRDLAFEALVKEEPAALPAMGGNLAPVLYGEPLEAPRGARWFPLLTLTTVVTALGAFAWPFLVLICIGSILGGIWLRLQLHGVMSLHTETASAIAQLIEIGRTLQLTELQSTGLRWLTMDVARMNEFTAAAVTYLNVMFLLDVHAFVRTLSLVRRSKSELVSLFENVGDRDAARSVAVFKQSMPTSEPVFEDGPVVMKALRHPLVENPVPNDLDLKGGMLVMGSNMSGKSTFLRAAALQPILAQSIGVTTCSEYRAPFLDVSALMQVNDDLLKGESHFLVEAKGAKEMLCGPATFCVVDELFRGTNTQDRVAAGSAFLRAMVKRGAYVIAATHDAELIETLPTFSPHYFTEQIANEEMTFDYKLHQGALAPRNALAVLKLVGFPPDVLEEASREFSQ